MEQIYATGDLCTAPNDMTASFQHALFLLTVPCLDGFRLQTAVSLGTRPTVHLLMMSMLLRDPVRLTVNATTCKPGTIEIKVGICAQSNRS